MVLLAGAALWVVLCASFVVSAAIIGMPPQTIAHTVAIATLNFGAIVAAISIAVWLGMHARHNGDRIAHGNLVSDFGDSRR